jgi:coatomer protein complex subunit gamma
VLYEMRKTDRMALVKMLQQYSQAGVIKSPAATMLLVRLASKLAEDDPGMRSPMFKLLDGFLRHKSEMVNFEACKAMCNFPDLTDAEAVQAIHVLQLFLTSPRAVTKFAAIRIVSIQSFYCFDITLTSYSYTPLHRSNPRPSEHVIQTLKP